MRHLFLSYRRDDTQYITGFIYSHLTAPAGFGPDSVFMDIDDIPPGVDFREVIDEAVSGCRFFLAVIGRQWATVCGPDGRPRLHNPNDFVRLEVEAALRRDIPVVPVLVDGAAMPKAEQLSDSLHPLLFKNAVTIRPGKQFGPDVDALVKGLHKAEEWKKRKAGRTSPDADERPHPKPAGVERPPSHQRADEGQQAVAEEVAELERLALREEDTIAFLKTRAPTRMAAWLAAAAAGNAAAMVLAAEAYDRGIGVTQNLTQAIHWYRTAAGQGNAAAMRSLGRAFASDAWYHAAAAAGSTAAINHLGDAYEHGKGVRQDRGEAVRWYRRGAEMGDAAAMYNLALALRHGRGIAQDRAEAVVWFRRAADSGFAHAMFDLGVALAEGRGVGRDEVEAARWYRRGAELGDERAMFNLGSALAHGRGAAQDRAEAVTWYQRAADLGHAPSMMNLGYAYERGLGVSRDQPLAAQWYRRAADLGLPNAMFNLGVVFAHGRGVPQDDAEAVRWYRRAADLGDASAMNNLGRSYEDGTGVERSREEAIRWYREAAALGNNNSKESLERLVASD